MLDRELGNFITFVMVERACSDSPCCMSISTWVSLTACPSFVVKHCEANLRDKVRSKAKFCFFPKKFFHGIMDKVQAIHLLSRATK